MSKQKDDAHRKFLAALPCIVCGDNISSECCHVRYTDLRAAKMITGLGRKPEDCWTVPLCGKHHREQHDYGDERMWWIGKGIDPIFVALALYRISGDYNDGLQIIGAARQ